MSGSGRGIAIAVIATTLLWVVAAVVAGYLLFGAREPQAAQVPIGLSPVGVPPVALVPEQVLPPDPGTVGDQPDAPLPAVPPVPLASGALSRIRMQPGQAHLDELLRAEVDASEASGRRVVAYFTANTCAPCRAVDRTLRASDVNARLGQLQLVEIDIDAFPAVELHRAGMALLDQEVEAIPLFCVLRSQQPPVCMDGAAWGADTDANIRSVLVPFLVSPPSGIAPREPDRITPI